MKTISLLLLTALATTAQAQTTQLKVELVGAGVFSTEASELTPTFSPDEKLAFWTVSTPSYARWTVILQSERGRNGSWLTPTVAPFSGQWLDADPFFTEDGQRVYFLSRRPLTGEAPERGFRIWYTDRQGNGWSTPVALPAHINNGDMHYAAPVRSGAVYIAGIRQDSNNQGDIYRIPFVNGAWQDPVNLGPVINAPNIHDTTPYVAPDESYIIYASTRPGGIGGLDMFISFRTGDVWSTPKLLPEPINSRVRDFCPIVSPGGQWLYFSSDRGFADEPLKKRVSNYAELKKMLNSTGNSVGDTYRTSLPALLEWARKAQ